MKTNRNPDWARLLRELALFQRAYGHIRVEEQGWRYPELARWLQGIRGRLERLTYDQIHDLDTLGFFGYLDEKWLDHYARLIRYKERMGHCRVPIRRPENRLLGNWVERQRRKAAKLAPWRRKLLTDLEFCFRVEHKDFSWGWDEVIKRLSRFRERFGNCNVPSRWPEDKLLVNWVKRLRSIKKSLDPEKIEQLDRLGFDWNRLQSKWEKRFQELTRRCLRPGEM